MRTINDIFNIILKETIILEEVKFKNNIDGIYLKLPGLDPTIGVNKSIVFDNKKYISVITEELGHHFTTSGDLTAECITYSDQINKYKKEFKARRWASDFLISDYEFEQALHSGASTMFDLEEYFGVTEGIIKYKIKSIYCNENKYKKIINNFKLHEFKYESCNI